MGRGDDGMKCIEVRTLLKKGAYEDALDVVETINIDKVKSIVNLKAIASAYERVGEYANAKAVLLQSYDIKRTKMTVYRLAYLSIKTEEFEDAEAFYQEFTEMAPDSPDRYILRYGIDRAKNVDYVLRIATLQKLKQIEYTEEWGYELAKIYHKAGLHEECIRECKDLIIWFGSGVIVDKARLLCKYHEEGRESLDAYGVFEQDATPEEIQERREKFHEDTADFARQTEQVADQAKEEELRRQIDLDMEKTVNLRQVMEAQGEQFDLLKKEVHRVWGNPSEEHMALQEQRKKAEKQMLEKPLMKPEKRPMNREETEAMLAESLAKVMNKAEKGELFADSQMHEIVPEVENVEYSDENMDAMEETQEQWEESYGNVDMTEELLPEENFSEPIEEEQGFEEEPLGEVPEEDLAEEPSAEASEEGLVEELSVEMSEEVASIEEASTEALEEETPVEEVSTEALEEETPVEEVSTEIPEERETVEETSDESLQENQSESEDKESEKNSVEDQKKIKERKKADKKRRIFTELDKVSETTEESEEEEPKKGIKKLSRHERRNARRAAKREKARRAAEAKKAAQEAKTETLKTERLEALTEETKEVKEEVTDVPVSEPVENVAEESMPKISENVVEEPMSGDETNVTDGTVTEPAEDSKDERMPETVEDAVAGKESSLDEDMQDTEEMLMAAVDEVMAELEEEKEKEAAIEETKELQEEEPEEPSFIDKYGMTLWEYFEKYQQDTRLCEDIYDALEKAMNGKRPLNFIITCKSKERYNELGHDIAKALKALGMKEKSRVGKIQAEKLNRMHLEKSYDEIKGGCILVEEARKMTADTAQSIMNMVNELSDQVVVILCDARPYMKDLLDEYPMMKRYFPFDIAMK